MCEICSKLIKTNCFSNMWGCSKSTIKKWNLFKVNNKDTRAMCDIYSKLTINALEQNVKFVRS